MAERGGEASALAEGWCRTVCLTSDREIALGLGVECVVRSAAG
jgi:hypothetical protein